MADWDADDFEPDTATPAVASMPSDKWDGEDEEDDIKVRTWSPHNKVNPLVSSQDAWDAESDEEKSEKSEEAKPVKVKKKKTLAQKIAEKEEAAEKARLEKMKMDEEEMEANTPEGRRARIHKDTDNKHWSLRHTSREDEAAETDWGEWSKDC